LRVARNCLDFLRGHRVRDEAKVAKIANQGLHPANFCKSAYAQTIRCLSIGVGEAGGLHRVVPGSINIDVRSAGALNIGVGQLPISALGPCEAQLCAVPLVKREVRVLALLKRDVPAYALLNRDTCAYGLLSLRGNGGAGALPLLNRGALHSGVAETVYLPIGGAEDGY
jgi:hypothetical protein